MSSNNKQSKTLGQMVKSSIVRSPIAPIDLTVNRSSRQIYSNIFNSLKADKKLVCPVCTQGFYHLTKEKGKNTPAVWSCEACGYEVLTQDNSQQSLKKYLEKNNSMLHQLGADMNLNFLSNAEKLQGVKKNLLKAKICAFISGLMLFLLPVVFVFHNFIAVVNTLLIFGFFLLQTLQAGFNAFKIHNDLFFVENHKQLSLMWLKRGIYFSVWDYVPKNQ